MKRKFLLLFLALFAFVLIGCKKDLTEFNALGGWKDGGDGVYDITANTEEKLVFTYAKGEHENAYLESAEIKQNLSGMKKLVITLQGSGGIKVELVGSKETKEVRLNVPANKGSYEWSLIPEAEFMKTLKGIKIYADPGKKNKTGNVEITELKFYNTEATNYIIGTGYDNIRENVNEYDGTSETFNFNRYWERHVPEEEVYTIEVEGTVTKVTVDKKGSGIEWACIQALVKGNFEKFNYVVAKVKGTAGMPFILKAKDGFETGVVLTGEEQYVAVDISELTAEEKNAIQAIFIFAHGGKNTGSGSFEIIEAFMIEEWDMGIIKNVYDGESETFAIEYWYDGGNGVYTVEDNVIKYDKDDYEWAFAEAPIVGDISGFGIIVIEITGQAGKKVMFKIEAEGQNVEKNIDLDGTKQTVEMIITSMSKEALKKVNRLLLFAAPGGKNAKGQFTLHSVTFMEHDAPVGPIEAKEDKDINSGWVDGGDGVYEFTENPDGSVTVTYDKGELEYPHFRQDFVDELAGYNTITLVLRGTPGKRVILKPNDDSSMEENLEFNEGDLVFTAHADEITKMIIMAEGGEKNVSGSFTIVSATLSYGADVTAEFEDGGDNVYTFEPNQDGSVTVNYDKPAGKEWSFLIANFEEKYLGFNTVTLVLRGPAGKSILLKPNDDGAYEKTLTFEEDEDIVYTVTADEIMKYLIFMEPGSGDVEGSFTIVEVTLSYVKPDKLAAKEEKDVNSDWVDGGDGVYEFTENPDGSVTVTYDKGEHEYPHFRQEFSGELAGYNTITLVLRGTPGKRVILKPNDDSSVEENLEFSEGDLVFIARADEITKIIIMAEGGEKNVSGSFTIVSATLSYGADVTAEFEDSGDGVYSFEPNQDGSLTVNYNKAAGQDWSSFKALFGDKYEGFNTITLVLRGPAGKSILLKPNDLGSLEETLTFEDEEDLVYTVTVDELVSIFMFMEPGTAPAQGSFTIVSATLSHAAYEQETKEDADITKGWVDGGDAVYEFTDNPDGTVTVNYEKGGSQFAHFRQDFSGELAGYKKITVVLKGEAGKSVTLKANDKYEFEETLTFENEEEITYTITAAEITCIIIMTEIDKADASGSFTIVQATLSME